MIANRFEDLMFWQKARELTKMVYSYTQNGEFKKDFGLKDQIQRACVSVMSNIAEGFGRGSNKEFVQFLLIARGSVSEVQSQLYISKDLNYITSQEFDTGYALTKEIYRMINSFTKNIMNSDSKELKKAPTNK